MGESFSFHKFLICNRKTLKFQFEVMDSGTQFKLTNLTINQLFIGVKFNELKKKFIIYIRWKILQY